MVGLDGDLGRGVLAHLDEDVLVAAVVAVDVEDDQVGVEGMHVVIGGAHEQLGSEPADAQVREGEVGVGYFFFR